MAEFSLVGLVPKPDTFRHPDGTVYEVRKASMLSIVQMAVLQHFTAVMPDAAQRFTDATDSAMRQSIAAELDQLASTAFLTLVPDMPPEQLAVIAPVQQLQFINWWQEQQDKEQATTPGEASAGQPKSPPRRGRRSPALSTPTA